MHEQETNKGKLTMTEIDRLILKWQIMRLGYMERIQKETDPEIVKTILSMDFQLKACIAELSYITDNEEEILTRRLLEGIQRVQEDQ